MSSNLLKTPIWRMEEPEHETCWSFPLSTLLLKNESWWLVLGIWMGPVTCKTNAIIPIWSLRPQERPAFNQEWDVLLLQPCMRWYLTSKLPESQLWLACSCPSPPVTHSWFTPQSRVVGTTGLRKLVPPRLANRTFLTTSKWWLPFCYCLHMFQVKCFSLTLEYTISFYSISQVK